MATNVEVQLLAITCCRCGCVFGVPTHYESSRRQDHEWFYCPSGHAQHYSAQTEAERLRGELANQKRRAEVFEAQASAASKRAEEANKMLDRAKAGVCPCCNRFFVNVHRHMQTKHAGKASAARCAAEAIAEKAGKK